MMTRRCLPLLLIAPLLVSCEGEKTARFGAVLPLTGGARIYGQSIEKGVTLAFEELSAQVTSGEFPYTIELTVEDSGSDPDRAEAALAQLYDAGAVAVIGGVTSGEALKMVPVADRRDQLLVSPSASNPELTGISKNFFRVFPSDAREGTTMGNFASQKLEKETVVILAKEDPYAKGIQEVFKSEFERNGGTVLDLVEFPPGSSDYSGLVARVMTLKPDAAYVAAYADDIAGLIEALRKAGYQGSIFTTSAFAAPEIIEQVGRPAKGVFLTKAVFDVGSDEPTVKPFVDAYRKKYGLDPDLYAAHGYDAVMVLAEAVKTGGTTPDEIWKGMRAIRDFPGVTGTIQFDERGDVQKFPRVYVIEEDLALYDYNERIQRQKEELRRKREELKRRLEQLHKQAGDG